MNLTRRSLLSKLTILAAGLTGVAVGWRPFGRRSADGAVEFTDREVWANIEYRQCVRCNRRAVTGVNGAGCCRRHFPCLGKPTLTPDQVRAICYIPPPSKLI